MFKLVYWKCKNCGKIIQKGSGGIIGLYPSPTEGGICEKSSDGEHDYERIKQF